MLVPILGLTLLVASGFGGLDAAPLDTVVVEEIDVKLPHNSSSLPSHTEAVRDGNEHGRETELASHEKHPVNSGEDQPPALIHSASAKDVKTSNDNKEASGEQKADKKKLDVNSESAEQVPEYPRVDEDEEKKPEKEEEARSAAIGKREKESGSVEKKPKSADEKASFSEKKAEQPSLTTEKMATSAEKKKPAPAEAKAFSTEKKDEPASMTTEKKGTSAEEKASSTEKKDEPHSMTTEKNPTSTDQKATSTEKNAQKPSLTTEKKPTSAEEKATSTEKKAEKSAEKQPDSREAKDETALMKEEGPINVTSAENEVHEEGQTDAAKQEGKAEDVSAAKFSSETNAAVEPGKKSANKDCASSDCKDRNGSEKPTKLGEETVPVFEDPSKKSSEEEANKQCDESEAPQSVKDAKAKLWKRRVTKVSRDPKRGKLTAETQVLSIYSDTKKAVDEAIEKPIGARRASDEVINDTRKDMNGNAVEESLPQSNATEETANSKDAESPADATYNSLVSDDAAESQPKEGAKGSIWGLGSLLSNLLPWLWGSPVVVVEAPANGANEAVTGNESPTVIEDEVEKDEKKTVDVDTYTQRAAEFVLANKF